MAAAKTLDATGSLCPMPVIKTQDQVKTMAHNSELIVVASDPGALHDIPAWCRVHGHKVLATSTVEATVQVHIRVQRSPKS